MKKSYRLKGRTVLSFILLFAAMLSVVACGGESQPFRPGTIPDDEYDPAAWGKVYPLHYESWKKTGEAKPAGRSKYRPGYDTDGIIYDRLSEYPYQALLYNGWGFGIEYNEPRGHLNAVKDQIDIDPSRTSPGGVCLACKTPFHAKLVEKNGMKYLTAKFHDALDMIPGDLRELGPACIDCHSPSDNSLRTNKDHFQRGLAMIGKSEFTHQEKRTLVCAQCHMTYYVPRNEKGKVAADVMPPWTGSKWSAIPIEKIIKDLTTDFVREEWTQKVTGFRMPYIRHPEFEFYTNNSVHWNAGVSCADCHMPYTRSGNTKISDHNVTSPLKTEPAMKACSACHTDSADWLKKQVTVIQDRTASGLQRSGYATATVAKLFEMVHAAEAKGKKIDQDLYKKAKDHYMKAFLRVVFIGAENSTGFHNPSEAGRVLGDASAHAQKSEALLRQALERAGEKVPTEIPLDLEKYLNNRGKKPVMFKKDQVVKDSFGNVKDLYPQAIQ